MAVDCWEAALENHRFNHPEVPTLNLELGGDLDTTTQQLRTYVDGKFGDDYHLHLHGSPPCQALSNISNHNPENGMRLVRWFLALVDHMKPDSWSMENVIPLAKRLDKTETPYVLVNSNDYGVPQARNRVMAGQGWTLDSTCYTHGLTFLDAFPHFRDIDDLYIISRRRCNSAPQTYQPDAPSHTVSQVTHRMMGKGVSRYLTVQETAVLQGWPDMRFKPGLRLSRELRPMVANMVTPPVAKALCEGIIC